MVKRLSFLIIILVLVGAVPAAAQREVLTHWDLNFRGGVSHANIYAGDELVQGSPRVGLAFMLSAELILNENVSWDFGIGLKQKGATGNFNSSAARDPNDPDAELDFDGDIKLGYIAFDANVNAGIPVGYSGWIGGFVGLGAGFLVNSTANGTLNGQPADLDLEGAIQGLDFYTIIGARYRYSYNNGVTLLFDYRAEVGITSIDASALDSGARTFANIFSIGVGIPILTDG